MRALIDQLARQYVALRNCAKVSITIDEPARPADIHRLKRTLPLLPRVIDNLFREGSGRIVLSWDLYDERAELIADLFVSSPAAFWEIGWKEMARIAETWPDRCDDLIQQLPETLRPNAESSAHPPCPLFDLMNGDILFLLPDTTGDGPVIYGDHETCESIVLAPSFATFLEHWIFLGCPGPERWNWEPLYDPELQRLNPDLPASRRYAQALGLALA